MFSKKTGLHQKICLVKVGRFANHQTLGMIIWLVVEPTHLKNVSQIGNLPPSRGENKKNLKPQPSQTLGIIVVISWDSKAQKFFPEKK